MLAAFEVHWNEAIVAFKESLEILETSEIHYLIGCSYFQIQNFGQASEHLEKAVQADDKFADAWFMLSIIYEILSKEAKAEVARQMAFNSQEAGAECIKFIRNKRTAKLDCAIPFLHLREDNKRLLTNGSLRMTRFFRKLVFDTLD
jgi:tetratricopeptide (TPR) repeat protein